MQRKHLIILIIALLAGGGFATYRAYQASLEKQLADKQAAEAAAETARVKFEAQKRTELETEAKRLADLKAAEEARNQEALLARLRAEQAANEAARIAAIEEARRVSDQLARLRAEKEAADLESRRLSDLRAKDSAAAELARLDAIKKLEDLERQTRELAAAQAAAQAALDAARNREPLWQPGKQLDRNILPADYKRRQHYYQQVFTTNAEASRPPSKPSPLKQ